MVTISAESIESAIAKLEDPSDEEFRSLNQRFMREQGPAGVFIMAMGDEDLSQAAVGLSLLMGMHIWCVFDAVCPSGMPQVSPETLMEAYENRETWLESFIGVDEDEMTRWLQITTEMPQEFVARHVIVNLMETAMNAEEELHLSEAEMGVLFWVLVSVMDAFDAAFQESVKGVPH